MRRIVLVMMAILLAGLAGCAQHDPNLRARGLEEFKKTPGGYTLSLKTYELDEKGQAKLVSAQDPSLTGFATRTLATKGYKQSAQPAYTIEAHLLCANPRKASLGLISEEIRIPAQAVGAGYHEELHFWLPGEASPSSGRESIQRREAQQVRRSRGVGMRANADPVDGTPFLRPIEATACQGRLLLLISPVAGGSPVREVYAARGVTAECASVEGCPVTTCRSALEDVMVNLIDSNL